MTYTPANGLAINGNFVSSGSYTPANGLNIIGNFAEGEVSQKRALILNGGAIIPIPDALIGTGQRPIILFNYVVCLRAAAEGIPLVLADDGFNLRTLKQTEQLIF